MVKKVEGDSTANQADIDDIFASSASESEEELEFDVGPNAEYISPPVDLRKKAPTRRPRRGETDAVAAAEAAISRMAVSFDGWMEQETQRLAELWAEADGSDFENEAREALYRAAHDIKGQAATLGFPLAGRVAGSLCRLLDTIRAAEKMPRDLVRQHVQSVRAMFVEHAREESSPMAKKLADRLDEVTLDYLGQIDRAA